VEGVPSLSPLGTRAPHGDTRYLSFFDANTRLSRDRHLMAVGASTLRHAPTHPRTYGGACV